MHLHAMGTVEEIDWLLKDVKRSALNLLIHKICKFKTFEFLLRCWIWSSDTKIVLSFFSTGCVWLTHPSSQRVIALVDIFFITDMSVFFRLHRICRNHNHKNQFFVYYCHIFEVFNSDFHKRAKVLPPTL